MHLRLISQKQSLLIDLARHCHSLPLPEICPENELCDVPSPPHQELICPVLQVSVFFSSKACKSRSITFSIIQDGAMAGLKDKPHSLVPY